MRYRLAPNVELAQRKGRSYLVSKAPLSLVGVNRSLARLVERLLEGTVSPAGEGEAKVLEQLAVRGLCVRLPEVARRGDNLPEVSVVIPVLDRADELKRCLASLKGLDYLPCGRVFHEHRSTLRSFMSRRFEYGTSEGTLQRLHPRRKKKFVLPPVLGLVLFLFCLAPLASAWCALAALLLVAGDAAAFAFRLARRGVPLPLPTLLGARVRALGGLCYYLSYHLIRYYLPVLVLLALIVPGFWAVPVAAFVACSGVDFAIRKPKLSYPLFAGIYALEQIAYGAGVFRGCLARKGFASYNVVFLKKMELTA
jgi:hypothetical protein